MIAYTHLRSWRMDSPPFFLPFLALLLPLQSLSHGLARLFGCAWVLCFSLIPHLAFANTKKPFLSWVEVQGPTQLRVGEEARFRCLSFDREGKPFLPSKAHFERRLVLASQKQAASSRPSSFGIVSSQPFKKKKRMEKEWVTRFFTPSLWEIHCNVSFAGQNFRSIMPLSVEVLPQVAHSLILEMPQKRRWYRLGETVQIQTKITDAFGFVHRHPAVVWRSSEAAFLPDAMGQLRLTRAGRFWIEAAVEGTPLRSRVVLDVDAQPPQVELSFPAKHAMIVGTSKILLKGRVTDAESGVVSLRFQGKVVQVDGKGNFAIPYFCRWGLNLLSFWAQDRAGHVRRFQRSFLYAPRYLSVKDADSSLLPLFSMRVAQRFLDRGSLETRADILTLLEDMIHATDLGKVRIKPIVGEYRVPPLGPTIRYRVVQRDAMRLDRIGASLRLFQDGFWLDLSLRRFVFPLDVFLNDDRQRITVDAKRVRFSLWFQVRRAANGRVFVKMPYRYADLSGLRVEGIHGLLSWFRGTVEQRVRGGLRDGLLGALQKRLLPSIQRSLARLPLNLSWTLPPTLGQQPLRMRLDLQSLRITPKALALAVGTSLRCEAPQFPRARGLPLLPPQPRPVPRAAFSSTVSVNALNQILYELWQCGVFQHDLSQVLKTRIKLPTLPFALPNIQVRFSTQLPPLLVAGDARYPLALALGGFRVRLDWSEKGAPSSSLHAEINLVVGARITTNAAGELLLILAPKPLLFQLQILQQSGTRSLSHEDWAAFLSGLILEQMPDAAVAIFRALPLHQDDPFLAIPAMYRSIFRAIRLWPRQIGFDGQRLLLDLDLLYRSPTQTIRTTE